MLPHTPPSPLLCPHVSDVSPTAKGHFQLDGASQVKRKEFCTEEMEVLAILGGSQRKKRSLMLAGDFFGWGIWDESSGSGGRGALRYPGLHRGQDAWGQKGGGSGWWLVSTVCGQVPQGVPERKSMGCSDTLLLFGR